jgi:hypothetical protein
MVRHSQREVLIMAVKLNELKAHFLYVVKNLAEQFSDNFFDFVEEFSSLIRRKVNNSIDGMRKLCHDAREAFKYLTEASVRSYPLDYSGEDFYAEVNS